MKLEHRYIVFKIKDINEYLNPLERTVLRDIRDRIDSERIQDGKDILDCIVVERDWPEYGPTLAAISARVDGAENAQE